MFCSLEKANALLLNELQQRELEYNRLQDDVKDLNDRLVNFRDEHSKELSKFNLYYLKVLIGHLVFISFLQSHKQSHNYLCLLR